jgi:hypothetical protein
MLDALYILLSLLTAGSFIWASINWVMVWWHLDTSEGPSESGSRELKVALDALRYRPTTLVPAALYGRFRLSLILFVVSAVMFGAVWLLSAALR